MAAHVDGSEQRLDEVHCSIHFLHRVATDVHVELLVRTLRKLPVLSVQLTRSTRTGDERAVCQLVVWERTWQECDDDESGAILYTGCE